MAKVRLFVRVRKRQGAYIASVPVRQLKKLTGYPKTRWSYQDVKAGSEGESVVGGWLILEAF